MDDNNFMSGFYAGRDANNNDGFGGNSMGGWGWIWIILILAVFCGGFGGGWGGFGGAGGAAGAAQNYVLSSDFATIQRQLSDGFNSVDNALDRQNAGICDLGYTQLSLANNLGTTIMQGNNALATQIAQCCCDNREAIAGVNYNLATHANAIQRQTADCCCDTQRQMERGFCDSAYRDASNTTALMQTTHNDADRILARIDKLESDHQAERIAQLTADNNALRFQISQEAQNNYLVSRLDPNRCPVPAYVVQPPQQVTFPVNCGGVASYATNSGCGCGYAG